MSIDIRPVTAADLPAVRAALMETWHATYDDVYGAATVEAITTRWHALETLAGQLHQPDSAFLMATDKGEVAASSFAARTADDVVHLYRLYVRPSAQRRGIGLDLMRATFARFTGARLERLEVEPRNSKAIAFYEREGYRLAGRTADCGGSSGVPALIYERQST